MGPFDDHNSEGEKLHMNALCLKGGLQDLSTPLANLGFWLSVSVAHVRGVTAGSNAVLLCPCCTCAAFVDAGRLL